MNLQQQENNMTVTCLIYRGSAPVTGSNSHASLSVHPSEETMTNNTNKVTSENSPSDRSQRPVHPLQPPTTSSPASTNDSLRSGLLDQQSTPSAPTSPPLPTKKQDPDPVNNKPFFRMHRFYLRMVFSCCPFLSLCLATALQYCDQKTIQSHS